MEPDKRRSIMPRLRAVGLWPLAAFLATVWLVGLLLGIGASLAGLVFPIAEAMVVLCLLLSLSDRDRWKTTTLLFLGGLALQVIEILFIQTLPQYADLPPDTNMYDLNARALVNHWRGLGVVAEDYDLRGGIFELQEEWLPTDWLAYASVFGTRSILYQIYVGVIYLLAGAQQAPVIFSHTVLLAALAPVVYNLSNLLFGNRRLSVLAASLTLLDPSFGGVSVFLLRDSLIAFVVAIALWTTVLVIKKPEAY